MEKEKIKLNIAGKNYVMYTSDDSRRLKRVAEYVGKKMDEIYLTSRMSTEDAAVMTAMNIGEELIRSQEENEYLRRRMFEITEKKSNKEE